MRWPSKSDIQSITHHDGCRLTLAAHRHPACSHCALAKCLCTSLESVVISAMGAGEILRIHAIGLPSSISANRTYSAPANSRAVSVISATPCSALDTGQSRLAAWASA